MSSFLKIAWIIVLTLSMFFSDFSSQLHTQAWNPTVNTVCSGKITDKITVNPIRERTDISFKLTKCAHIILKFYDVTKNSQRNLVGVIETREGRQLNTVSISKINSSISLIQGKDYEVEVISYASPRYTGQLDKQKSNPFTIPRR